MLTDRDLPDFSVESSHLFGLTPGDRPGDPRRLFGSSSSSRGLVSPGLPPSLAESATALAALRSESG